MKKVIIIEQKINSACYASLVNFSEKQIWDVRDAILKAEFLALNKSDISIFQKERNTFILSKDRMMTAEFYRGLMQYFFSEQAFSDEEERNLLLTTQELTPRDFFIAADELLIFKGENFVSVIRETIKDNIENISDTSLIISVRSAFIEQINKL